MEICVECSAKLPLNVSEVFYFAQKAVLLRSTTLGSMYVAPDFFYWLVNIGSGAETRV